jgi:hypothetical protein
MTKRVGARVNHGVLAVVLAAGLAGAACSAEAPPAPAAQAPPAQGSVNVDVTNEVLQRHMDTFGKQDVPGVLADYAADAVMFTPNGPVRGTDALRKTFEQLFAEWGKPGVKFDLKQRTVDGKNAYIYWDAETADNVYEGAVDAFVVENGKIVAHFFAGKITPKAKTGAK